MKMPPFWIRIFLLVSLSCLYIWAIPLPSDTISSLDSSPSQDAPVSIETRIQNWLSAELTWPTMLTLGEHVKLQYQYASLMYPLEIGIRLLTKAFHILDTTSFTKEQFEIKLNDLNKGPRKMLVFLSLTLRLSGIHSPSISNQVIARGFRQGIKQSTASSTTEKELSDLGPEKSPRFKLSIAFIALDEVMFKLGGAELSLVEDLKSFTQPYPIDDASSYKATHDMLSDILVMVKLLQTLSTPSFDINVRQDNLRVIHKIINRQKKLLFPRLS
jgi:hypothetical protein